MYHYPKLYILNYVSAEIGYGSRVSAFIDLSKNTAENGISEPHNLVYRVELFARPPQAKWNISAYVTNKGKTYHVTMIGQYAFWGCYNQNSVTVPSHTKIGEKSLP